MVAVGVEQVRQRLQFLPLLLVVAAELARIGALARGLDLDESDQGVAEGDRVIRAGLERGDRRLADGLHGILRETAKFGQIVDQSLQRRTELIFRLAGSRHVVEFRLGLGAVASDGGLQGRLHLNSPTVAAGQKYFAADIIVSDASFNR